MATYAVIDADQHIYKSVEKIFTAIRSMAAWIVGEECQLRRSMNLKLQRVSLRHDSPTYGVLLSNDIPLCLILERPWKDNLPSVSCIPEGKYLCEAYESEKFGKTWEVTNVPMRSYILFHAGNTINDSKGCLLTGLSFSPGGVSHSKDAMALLRRTLPPKFTLEILNPKES